MSDEKTMGQVIQIDEARIRDRLGEIVCGGGPPLSGPSGMLVESWPLRRRGRRSRHYP
jgi:hypothetical protein